VLKNLSFLIIFLLICGCSTPKKKIISESLDATVVITGSVVNASAFAKGGTLLLGPFKPGPGAAADNETDQLSLMMDKGIKDALPGDNTHFSIQTDDLKDPDFYLEGTIEDYGRKGHLTHLSVDGEIWLREYGERIFIFQTSVMIDLKTQNPRTVAYQIGTAVAHFMGSRTR
jgi:hypothetical protein